MIEILRNMVRRKLRTGLTVLGIVIGVFALTVMGAMAEKMNLLVGGGVEYYSGHVTVTQAADSQFGTAPISTAKIPQLAQVPGVAAVAPLVMMPLKDSAGATMGTPDMVVGYSSTLNKYEKFKLTASQGRIPSAEQRNVISVGSSIARTYNLRVGQTFMVRKRPFVVKAILNSTMTAPDGWVMMNLRDAQNLFVAGLPPMLRHAVQPSEIASAFNVYPRPGVTGDALASRIKASGISDLKVMSPSDARKQFDQISIVFNLIVMGSAIIALVVGALSVINTMAMSVSERVKEIGLKKAIGAHTSQILEEYLLEAAIIGLVGGLIGLGLGSVLVTVINNATLSSGTQIFAITTRLAIGAVLFATVLGTAAGLLPALRAARLNPVEALRSE